MSGATPADPADAHALLRALGEAGRLGTEEERAGARRQVALRAIGDSMLGKLTLYDLTLLTWPDAAWATALSRAMLDRDPALLVALLDQPDVLPIPEGLKPVVQMMLNGALQGRKVKRRGPKRKDAGATLASIIEGAARMRAIEAAYSRHYRDVQAALAAEKARGVRSGGGLPSERAIADTAAELGCTERQVREARAELARIRNVIKPSNSTD